MTVRLVGASTPTPPPAPGGDPLGLVQDWLDLMETKAIYYMQTVPQDPANGLGVQLEYDGTWCVWQLSKLLATQNPTVAQLLFDYGQALLLEIWNYADMSFGPLADAVLGGAPAYYNYNLGPRVYGMDPATVPPGGSDPSRISCNYARFSSYTGTLNLLYYIIYGDNTFPSSTSPGLGANIIPGVDFIVRPMARALSDHLVTDAIYDQHEARVYNGYTYLYGHQLWIPRVVGHWFLGQDVNMNGKMPLFDRWRDITAQLAAVGGDFSQVPDSWSEQPLVTPSYEYTPWAWAHACLSLILYYEDDSYTGVPHDRYKALITRCVTDMCDAGILYFRRGYGTQGRFTLLYRIKANGDETGELSPDTALWFAPMFAWAYKQTGNVAYYNMAVELIDSGINDAYIIWGKHVNECTYAVWWTFQWLGWTDTAFKLPWKFDLGSESWP